MSKSKPAHRNADSLTKLSNCWLVEQFNNLAAVAKIPAKE